MAGEGVTPDRGSGEGGDPSFAYAAFDALPTELAILDETGEIVYTNRAWREFGEANDLRAEPDTIGVNYLAVCEGSEGEAAARAARGILAVLAGERETFAMEYPCHSPEERRWFTMRAIAFAHGGERWLLVMHLNITERKLSELAVERRNEQLRTLDEINGLVRDTVRSMLEVDSREDLERAVCERLADSSFYACAWTAERDIGGGGLAPRIGAGVSDVYLNRIERLDADATASAKLLEPFESGMSAMLDRGALDDRDLYDEEWASCAAIPLVHGGTVYGVLVVAAREEGAFDRGIRAGLATLGEVMGHAIDAIESKKLLFADTMVELEFEIVGGRSPLGSLAATAGARIDLDGYVPIPSGGINAYLSVSEAPPERVLDAIEGIDGIEDPRAIGDADDGEWLLECRLVGGSPAAALTERGAYLRRACAGPEGTLRIVANAPLSANARDLVEAVQSVAPDATLRAKREVERSVTSARDFRNELHDRLTERQLAVLEAAYFAGYFERPRKSTGQEIAASLDIASPTFHQHLGAALGKLTSVVVEHRP